MPGRHRVAEEFLPLQLLSMLRLLQPWGLHYFEVWGLGFAESVPGRHRVAEEFLPLQLLSMLRLRVLSLAGCWNVHIPLCVGELQDLQQLVVRCVGCLVILVGP